MTESMPVLLSKASVDEIADELARRSGHLFFLSMRNDAAPLKDGDNRLCMETRGAGPKEVLLQILMRGAQAIDANLGHSVADGSVGDKPFSSRQVPREDIDFDKLDRKRRSGPEWVKDELE